MRLCASLMLAFAGFAAQSVAAATISIHAERRGDAVDIRASAALNADAATAWRVLTDYDAYPRFIPDLLVSRVIARRGATVTVEQSGHARLWLLRIPLEVTYEIREFPPYRLRSRAVAGSMRSMDSVYLLTPTSSGVGVEYAGRVEPGFDLFGRIEEYVVRENVARQFQALVDEIERVGAATGRAAAQ